MKFSSRYTFGMFIGIAVFLFAFWASGFSIVKMALAHAAPTFLTGVRMTLAGIILLLFLLLAKRASLKITLRQFGSLCLLGFFSIYLTNILEFWSLQHLSAGKTCFLYSFSPLFTALLSYIHFKEKMTPRKWLGLSIGFVGIIPVLLSQTQGEALLNALSIFSWPALAMIGAAFASVYGWVLLRLVVKDQAISPFMANGISMVFGGVLALAHSFLVDTWSPVPLAAGHTREFATGVIFMVFCYNILCYNLYGMLLRRFTATFLSFIGLLSPIFASLSGWLFLDEPISPLILFSTAIVGAGLTLFYLAELKQGYLYRT